VATHELGALGELAVARLLGGRLDESPRPGGDDGRPDVLLPDGRGVNVKTRSRSGYDFLLDPNQDSLRADYGVLCYTIGGKLLLEVVGWLTDADLQQYGVRRDYGHGPRLALAARHLRPITALLKEVA